MLMDCQLITSADDPQNPESLEPTNPQGGVVRLSLSSLYHY